MNEVLRTIHGRCSLRKFAGRLIDKDTKNALFEAAMRAPTAGNQMLYAMIDITDQVIKERLAVLCDNQPFIAKAPMVVVFAADQQRWFDYYDMNGVKAFCAAQEDMCFEAPQESDLLLACEDAMCAAQTMVIAAESLGIGSCYIGDILENFEDVSALLKLPDWVFPLSMLVLGYPENGRAQRAIPRFDQKYIVYENTYKRLGDDELRDMYKDVDKKYNPDNAAGAKNYAQQFYARKTGAAFSKEMARSVRVALKKWDGRKL